MAVRPERVLAIDVARQTVRGIVLVNGTPAIAGGYAQLDFEPADGPVAFAARIATALDVKTTLPVAITCDPFLGDDVASQVKAAIVVSGFAAVTIMSRHEAVTRTNPVGGEPDALVGVEIPSGLLTSHVGLTLVDLAAVVGAGLELLHTDVDAVATESNEVVQTWSPASSAPPAPETDPFTSAPSHATAAGVAATVAAAAAAAAVGDDEDLTVAAPASRATSPTVGQRPSVRSAPSDGGLDGDITGPASTNPDDVLPDPAASATPHDDAARGALAAASDEHATVNPDELPAASATPHDDAARGALAAASDEDATVNPDELPAAAMAAALGRTEDNIDETVVIDRSTLRQAADTETAAVARDVQDQPQSGGRRVLMMVFAAVVLVALVGLAVTQCGGSDSNPTSAAGVTIAAVDDDLVDDAVGDGTQADPAIEATTDSERAAAGDDRDPIEAEEPAATPAPQPESTPEPTPEAEPAAEPEPTADPLEGLPPLSSLPERGAIFRPPTLFLGGPVQTQEQADELYARAIAVVGPDNVVNNYVVRPDAPAAVDGNVRVEQAVLFQSGSAVIADEFVPTLELGVAVMALNPQVQMVVEGHTDSVGSDSGNLVLSQRRAQAVVDYLVSRGVNSERLDAVGFGESAPVATNETDRGRQINRRIEVELIDLLAAE